MASNALEEKINKIRQQNEEIRRRYEVYNSINIFNVIKIYIINFIYIFLM